MYISISKSVMIIFYDSAVSKCLSIHHSYGLRMGCAYGPRYRVMTGFLSIYLEILPLKPNTVTKQHRF